MYSLDPSAGREWLRELQHAHHEEAAQISDLRPTLREASDGSTEILTTIVLRDSVMRWPTTERGKLLAKLEQWIKDIILGSNYANLGWPLVGFMSETEARQAAGRL